MEAALPLEPTEFDLSVEDTGDVSNMTAEQYLSWVRYQAGNLPNWKRVEVAPQVPNRQSKYMPEVDDIVTCPVDCLPSDEWQRELLYAFSELRQTLESFCQDESSKDRKVVVPQMKDHAAWERFCFASEVDPTSLSAEDDFPDRGMKFTAPTSGDETATSTQHANMQGTDDAASGMVSADSTAGASDAQRAVNKRKRDLEYQLGISYVKNTESASENGQECDNESASVEEDALGEELNEAIEGVWADAAAAGQWTGATDVEPTTSILLQFDQVLTQRLLALQIDWLEERTLTPARGRWLYALLARLEKPLYRETAASIRQLYRRCCALRLQLSQTSAALSSSSSSSSTDDATAAVTFQNQLASLNVLISIAGSYFGQGEEFDAFNRALMQETAEYDAEQENEQDNGSEGADGYDEDADGDDEEGNWEEVEGEGGEGYDEDGFADTGAKYSHHSHTAGVDSLGGADAQLSEWVPVTVAQTVPAVSSVINGNHRSSVGQGNNSGAMELEDGEEMEAVDGDFDHSSKKSKTDL